MSPFPWSRRGRKASASQGEPSPEPPPDPVVIVRAYHQATKHGSMRYARGPQDLDWANQPDPFRRWDGAPRASLVRLPPELDAPGALLYTQAYGPEARTPAALDAHSLSHLLFDAFALSAWKEFGQARWALRVNPSSGNLHPTEVHVLCTALAGIADTAFAAHYAPREHELELRAELPGEQWTALMRELPAGSLLVALTSIHWREAWKYGERAWRYCQHDAGHALAALSLSAAALGWRTRLLDAWGSDDIARLLGLAQTTGPEAETPDMLVAVTPSLLGDKPQSPPEESLLAQLDALAWRGTPSALSDEHLDWEVIEIVSGAAHKPRGMLAGPSPAAATARASEAPGGPPWREVVHHRRSAVDMDGRTSMGLEDFASVLRRCLPGAVPFDALTWAPAVDLVLFVHRVEGLERGLYLLLREPAREADLRAALRPEFDWERPLETGDLPLYRLHTSDLRGLAARASCGQAIAGDGCFSLGMLADLGRLDESGAALYPRLFWETGAIGQVLYLEAEALGLRGTGIGCFFDDEVHAVLGLRDARFQSLYHFAFGAPLEDGRLSTLPAYGD